MSDLVGSVDEAMLDFEIKSEARSYLARYASDSEQTQYSVNIRITRILIEDQEFEVSAPATALISTSEFPFHRGQILTATGEQITSLSDSRSCCLISISEMPMLVEEANFAYKFAHDIRSSLKESLSGRQVNGDALVPGLVLGDTSLQSSKLEASMRGSGLAHLTAVSGGNVTIVLGLFIAVFSLFGFSARYLVAIAALALSGYVLAVGFDASVMRAATMGSITLIAFLSKKAITTGAILLSAVYLLTIFNPWLWLNWGFLLSVFATGALIWLAPKIMSAITWPKPFDLLAGLIAATMAATWVTAPLLALMTQNVPVVSIISNLIAAPLVAITTILGLIAALVSLASPDLAMPISFVASIPAELIGQIALWAAGLPGAQLELDSLVGISIFLLGIISVIGLLITTRYKRVTFILVFSLVISYPLLIQVYRQLDGWPPKGTFLIACDVGQGTAVVLPLTRTEAVLIDTGPEPQKVNNCLSRLGIDSLAAVFISHFHADHAGAFEGIVASRPVGQVYVSPNPNPLNTSKNITEIASSSGIPQQVVSYPFTVTIGEYTIKTLWPYANDVPTNENDSSLILLISKNSANSGDVFEFLFTGDIEPTGQIELMRSAPLSVDAALVPHHGSRFQQPGFAEWTGAGLGVISVGDNSFGHPSDDAILEWRKTAAILRTDLYGDIALFEKDGALRAGN